jgi:hypothetical protein
MGGGNAIWTPLARKSMITGTVQNVSVATNFEEAAIVLIAAQKWTWRKHHER